MITTDEPSFVEEFDKKGLTPNPKYVGSSNTGKWKTKDLITKGADEGRMQFDNGLL